MIALTFPEVTPGDWVGVIVDQHEIAGTPMWRTQARGRDRGAIERNWHTSRAEAMAFALDRADRRCLPLLDLCGGEAE